MRSKVFGAIAAARRLATKNVPTLAPPPAATALDSARISSLRKSRPHHSVQKPKLPRRQLLATQPKIPRRPAVVHVRDLRRNRSAFRHRRTPLHVKGFLRSRISRHRQLHLRRAKSMKRPLEILPQLLHHAPRLLLRQTLPHPRIKQLPQRLPFHRKRRHPQLHPIRRVTPLLDKARHQLAVHFLKLEILPHQLIHFRRLQLQLRRIRLHHRPQRLLQRLLPITRFRSRLIPIHRPVAHEGVVMHPSTPRLHHLRASRRIRTSLLHRLLRRDLHLPLVFAH